MKQGNELNLSMTVSCKSVAVQIYCAESQVEMLKYMLSSWYEAQLYHTPAHPRPHPCHYYDSASGTSKAGTNGLDALALLAADIVEKDNHGPK